MTWRDGLAARFGSRLGDKGHASEGPSAAVAVVLRERGGKHADGLEMFFIKRAERDGDPWSGHVAFPGGRRDAADESLFHTAIRETFEEVGIDLRDAEWVGRLSDESAFLKFAGKTLYVSPFVFVVSTDAEVTTNHEVADWFWVPVPVLTDDEQRKTFELEYQGTTHTLTCVDLKGGAHRLWGITLRIVDGFFGRGD